MCRWHTPFRRAVDNKGHQLAHNGREKSPYRHISPPESGRSLIAHAQNRSWPESSPGTPPGSPPPSRRRSAAGGTPSRGATPRYDLPSARAASATPPEPANGSSTRPPSGVQHRTRFRSSPLWRIRPTRASRPRPGRPLTACTTNRPTPSTRGEGGATMSSNTQPVSCSATTYLARSRARTSSTSEAPSRAPTRHCPSTIVSQARENGSRSRSGGALMTALAHAVGTRCNCATTSPWYSAQAGGAGDGGAAPGPVSTRCPDARGRWRRTDRRSRLRGMRGPPAAPPRRWTRSLRTGPAPCRPARTGAPVPASGRQASV